MLNNSLASVGKGYEGTHPYFNDDVVGRLFDWIGTVVKDNILTPFVHGVTHGDPLCLLLAAALITVAVGFFLRLGANLADAMTRSGK